MIKLYPKKAELRFCKGLTSKEFACQCNYESCRATIITHSFIKAYKAFRELVNVPLRINSGYRCPAHNLDIEGSALSRHQTGEAVDISLKTLNHLSNDDIEFAAKKAGFIYVKFYKSWVHLDVRELRS